MAVDADADDDDRGGGGSFLDIMRRWCKSYLGMCGELQQTGDEHWLSAALRCLCWVGGAMQTRPKSEHKMGWKYDTMLAGWLAGLILLRSWLGIAIAEEEEDSQAIYQQHFGLNGKQHFARHAYLLLGPSCRCFFCLRSEMRPDRISEYVFCSPPNMKFRERIRKRKTQRITHIGHALQANKATTRPSSCLCVHTY